jgi:GLPGLI family protein
MKQTFIAILLLAGTLHVIAQAPLGGTIVYTRTTTYNFEPTGNNEWDAYALTLPTEGKLEKVLYFTAEASLYDVSSFEKEAVSIPQQKVEFFASHGKAPRPALKSLYIDFREERRTALKEFMTREFLVESPLENKGWKLDPARKKIGEYVCMKATMNMEGDTVTAWFAPELSVPAGPSEYYGLPGIVLAVERLGETVLLATSIDLTPPPAELLVKPEAGKKTSPEAFEQIVEEKVEEFKNNGSAESDYYRK